jgi:co-chaperonin GroES (HSP10)
MNTFTPQGSRVLIKRLDEQKLESAFIEVVHLDETKESQIALILAVGPKVTTVRPLETVVTPKYSGAPLMLELVDGAPKEQCYLVMETDLLGVFRDEPKMKSYSKFDGPAESWDHP